MSDTASHHDSIEAAAVAIWPNLEPDAYLDARRADWVGHERAGRVRYLRLCGQRTARIFIDPDATAIVTAIDPHRDTRVCAEAQANGTALVA